MTPDNKGEIHTGPSDERIVFKEEGRDRKGNETTDDPGSPKEDRIAIPKKEYHSTEDRDPTLEELGQLRINTDEE